MNLAEVAEMRNMIMKELRQIEALKRSINQTLARLDRWEKHLRRGTVDIAKTETGRRAVDNEDQPKPQRAIKPATLRAGEKVNKALATVRGEFTRSQLLVEAERYGEGTIGVTTYRRIFSALISTERIRCVAGRPHEPNSRFVRSEEKKSDQASDT